MKSKRTPPLYVAAGLLYGAALFWASPAQAIVNTGDLCSAQTSSQERKDNIPRHLLRAISLAESSLWDSEKGAIVAWPWTVTSGGKGRYFATKTDALTYVLELWSKNITNIDVGCMQINLGYHAGAFDNLEQAFDPASNVAYASRYLLSIFKTTRSWTQAAAYYHSTTPEKYRPYKLKVLKFWNRERQLALGAGAIQARPYTPSRTIDRLRTEKLNTRFKATRTAEQALSATEIRRLQMAARRDFRGGSSTMAKLASMRRAQLEALRIRELRGKNKSADPTIFAKKRRKQLEKWRLDRQAANSPS